MTNTRHGHTCSGGPDRCSTCAAIADREPAPPRVRPPESAGREVGTCARTWRGAGGSNSRHHHVCLITELAYPWPQGGGETRVAHGGKCWCECGASIANPYATDLARYRIWAKTKYGPHFPAGHDAWSEHVTKGIWTPTLYVRQAPTPTTEGSTP